MKFQFFLCHFSNTLRFCFLDFVNSHWRRFPPSPTSLTDCWFMFFVSLNQKFLLSSLFWKLFRRCRSFCWCPSGKCVVVDTLSATSGWFFLSRFSFLFKFFVFFFFFNCFRLFLFHFFNLFRIFSNFFFNFCWFLFKIFISFFSLFFSFFVMIRILWFFIWFSRNFGPKFIISSHNFLFHQLTFNFQRSLNFNHHLDIFFDELLCKFLGFLLNRRQFSFNYRFRGGVNGSRSTAAWSSLRPGIKNCVIDRALSSARCFSWNFNRFNFRWILCS